MPNLAAWLFRSLFALLASGVFATAVAATPAQIGVFRDGEWFLDANGNGVWDGAPTDIYYAFGLPGDIPVVGDWNGDGITKIGIFRGGFWWLDYNGNGVWDEGIDKFIVFGQSGDKPVAGDWNGDGKAKIGVFRPRGASYPGEFYLDYNGNNVWDAGDYYDAYSGEFNEPVVGDWNGDGRTKVGTQGTAFYPQPDGTYKQMSYPEFRLDENGTGSSANYFYFGLVGDKAVIGDWNGDGKSKVGMIRDGRWILDYNGNRLWDGTPTDKMIEFGLSGDKPLVAKRWK